MPRTVLAIDPGHRKCGMALVSRRDDDSIALQWRCIAPPIEVPNRIREALDQAAFDTLVMGRGTSSREMVERIREQFPSLGILLVDEQDTSVQARERYWEYHPRRGWRRLLPSSLQVPPAPIDDFAALILAERVLLA